MGLYLRSETWYYLFYVNGRRYRGSTNTTNRKSAAKIMAGKMAAAEAGELLRPKKPPLLREYLTEFSGWIKTINKAPKTRVDYLNGCRLIGNSDLAAVRLDRITAGDIEATHFHASPYSTNCALRTLRRALRRALEKEIIRKVPRIKLLDAPRRELVVTAESEQRILAAIRHDDTTRRYKKLPPSPLADVFLIMMDLGMRDGEVAAMRIERIHLALDFYQIPKSKTKKGRRQVPISKRVKPILERLIGERREGWLFPSTKSKSGHIELRGLQKRFRRIARQLGIPDELKIYCARHACGTDVMADAKDPRLVMDFLGQEDLATTMNYMHPDIKRVKQIIDKRNESRLVN